MGKRFHEMEPGELSGPGREIAQALVDNAVRFECGLFDSSGDESHLWRAWRAARSVGTPSPFSLEWLMPRLDALAAMPNNEKRAAQREERNGRLLDYYHEIANMHEGRPGCAQNLKDARERVAKRHNTTEATIYQLLQKFEGLEDRKGSTKGKL
jgi:hypothetical protein